MIVEIQVNSPTRHPPAGRAVPYATPLSQSLPSFSLPTRLSSAVLFSDQLGGATPFLPLLCEQVLRLVQKQLKAPRTPEVTHASLTRGAKRRTAAGAFFELLQVCGCGCGCRVWYGCAGVCGSVDVDVSAGTHFLCGSRSVFFGRCVKAHERVCVEVDVVVGGCIGIIGREETAPVGCPGDTSTSAPNLCETRVRSNYPFGGISCRETGWKILLFG